MIISRLRLLQKATLSHIRLQQLLLLSSSNHSSSKYPKYPQPQTISPNHQFLFNRFLSTSSSSSNNGNNNNDNDNWSFSTDVNEIDNSWMSESSNAAFEKEEEESWSLVEDEGDKKKITDFFDIDEELQQQVEEEGSNADDVIAATAAQSEIARIEEEQKKILLQKEENELLAIIKGPNRAFGDLIAASGILDDMLDSLLALKDFEGIEGLPPLHEIEDLRYENSKRKSTRAEMELRKQEEVAKARVRQVDDKGRSYGTGRRKCSIARVWIQPGAGEFVVNDKQFDVYFPMLDHRAALLQPFSETKTLGLWDVKCTVKGGGVSGQVGAIQLGVSRALQNWEPDLRPPLRAGGLLTRDPRVVERKKPGKAKARKSFQWVKR
ncbi:hypothetical protein ACFE04_022513 [Oxalis oulophora]